MKATGRDVDGERRDGAGGRKECDEKASCVSEATGGGVEEMAARAESRTVSASVFQLRWPTCARGDGW